MIPILGSEKRPVAKTARSALSEIKNGHYQLSANIKVSVTATMA